MKTAKKTVALLLIVLMALMASANAVETVDYSAYSTDELLSMLNGISAELKVRMQSVPADSNIEDFRYVSSGTEIRINGYVGKGGDVVIPSSIDSIPVTRLAENAFACQYDNEYEPVNPIASVTFPDTLVEIGDCCFDSQTLNSVIIIPESVERIGANAFANTQLEGVVIGADCEIDFFAFPCLNMDFVYIRDGFSHPLSATFYADSQMSIAVIPSTVTEIDDDAFYGCSNVTIITPSGSFAEKYAKEHFLACETESYEEYVSYYESLYFPTYNSSISDTVTPSLQAESAETNAMPTMNPFTASVDAFETDTNDSDGDALYTERNEILSVGKQIDYSSDYTDVIDCYQRIEAYPQYEEDAELAKLRRDLMKYLIRGQWKAMDGNIVVVDMFYYDYNNTELRTVFGTSYASSQLPGQPYSYYDEATDDGYIIGYMNSVTEEKTDNYLISFDGDSIRFYSYVTEETYTLFRDTEYTAPSVTDNAKNAYLYIASVISNFYNPNTVEIKWCYFDSITGICYFNCSAANRVGGTLSETYAVIQNDGKFYSKESTKEYSYSNVWVDELNHMIQSYIQKMHY